MERHVVVKMLAREQLEPLGVERRDFGVQLDDHPTVFGVEVKRVLRIETGRERFGEDWCCTHDGEQYGKDAGHVISRMRFFSR